MAAAQVSGNAATLVNGIRVQCLDPTIFWNKHICSVSSICGWAMFGIWGGSSCNALMDIHYIVDFLPGYESKVPGGDIFRAVLRKTGKGTHSSEEGKYETWLSNLSK